MRYRFTYIKGNKKYDFVQSFNDESYFNKKYNQYIKGSINFKCINLCPKQHSKS